MRKILRQTLAIFLVLAMLLGDNAVAYATESTDTSSETAITEEADDGAENAVDEEAVEDEAAGEDGTDAIDETTDINTAEEASKAKIEQSASDAGGGILFDDGSCAGSAGSDRRAALGGFARYHECGCTE